jgi:hypothetical protein
VGGVTERFTCAGNPDTPQSPRRYRSGRSRRVPAGARSRARNFRMMGTRRAISGNFIPPIRRVLGAARRPRSEAAFQLR